jgi:hypothetical protein
MTNSPGAFTREVGSEDLELDVEAGCGRFVLDVSSSLSALRFIPVLLSLG